MHGHFEHQGTVVIHTSSKTTGGIDNIPLRKKKVLLISIGDMTHVSILREVIMLLGQNKSNPRMTQLNKKALSYSLTCSFVAS